MRVAGAAFLLIAAAVALMLWRESLPILPLADGAELRVLKISAGQRHYFSDEKGWRRFAIDHLSQKALTKLGLARKEIDLPHGGLVVWAGKFAGPNHKRVPPKLTSAEVEFSDGRRTSGRITLVSSNVAQIVFPVYPRADKKINLRMVDDSQQVSFVWKNPEPAKLKEWTAVRLPQTNTSGAGIITVTGDLKSGLILRIRDPKGGSAGWTQWRIDVEDSVGNWEQFIVNSPRIQEFCNHVWQPGPLKLTVQAREFLSAGFVTNRQRGVIQEMDVNERASKLGFGKLFYLGHGEYLFTNGVPSVHIGAPLGTNVTMKTTNSAGQWDVHLAAVPSSVVAVYPASARVESFEARLRERTSRGDGGVVYTSYRRPIDARSPSPARWLRQFEVPMFRSTNSIQAEIIARHHPVEFIIEQAR